MIVATWVGISIIVILNVVGWFLAYNRYSRNEARHLGKLEGKVDGLGTSLNTLESTMKDRMESLEERMGNLEQRLDSVITSR